MGEFEYHIGQMSAEQGWSSPIVIVCRDLKWHCVADLGRMDDRVGPTDRLLIRLAAIVNLT